MQEYFAGRPDDLLVMSVTEGEGWEVLCPFLGHAVPEAPFPHLNSRERRAERRRLRKLGLRADGTPRRTTGN